MVGGVEGPKAYLSLDELAEQLPWTRHGVLHLIRKGLLKKGLHWFQPGGAKSQILFKWAAICDFIEGREAALAEASPNPQDVEDEVRRRLDSI